VIDSIQDHLAETLAQNEKRRSEEIETLKADANRLLRSSQEESANLLKRIERLKTERAEQGAQFTVATQRLADAQAALAEQIALRASVENHVSLLTGNLERAKAELHDALGAAESLATNLARIEVLEHTIREVESKAASLLERHKSGSLVSYTHFLTPSNLTLYRTPWRLHS
jgi:DNA repair exonuclease SbcCD ATPase subunit